MHLDYGIDQISAVSQILILYIKWFYYVCIIDSFILPLIPDRSSDKSKLTLGERQGTFWTGWQSTTRHTYIDRHHITLTFTPTGQLEAPINLSCMFLACGKKLEYLERTSAG